MVWIGQESREISKLDSHVMERSVDATLVRISGTVLYIFSHGPQDCRPTSIIPVFYLDRTAAIGRMTDFVSTYTFAQHQSWKATSLISYSLQTLGACMRLSRVTTYTRRVLVNKGYHWEIVVGKTPVVTCSRVSHFRYRKSTPVSTELLLPFE